VHRYEELEKLYYKKKALKYFIVILGVGVIFFIYDFFKKPSKVSKDINLTKEKKVLEFKKEIKETKKDKNITKKYEKISFILPKVEYNYSAISTENKKIKKQKIIKPKKIESKKIESKITEKEVTLNDLIQKFNLNKSYDLALLIAKGFFKKKDLKNAKIWTIKANSMNPERVESWILFSDILLEKGEKEKAIEILKIYLDTYGNNKTIENKIRSINE